MIFVVSLVASLANVRFKWLASGSLGSAQSTGITQVGTWPIFRIDSDPPVGAEELIVYDVTDDTNATRAHYAEQAPASGGGSVDTAAIADAVWDELLSGHTINGSAGKALSAAGTAGDPWSTHLPGSYAAGTAGAIVGSINPPVVTVLNAITREGNKITARAADTWSIAFAGLSDLTGHLKLWFSINEPGADDDAAKAFIEETAGLTRVNGDAYTTTTNGSIEVTDVDAGDLTVTLDKAVTAVLAGTTRWAIKMMKADNTTVTLSAGGFVIVKHGIEAIA